MAIQEPKPAQPAPMKPILNIGALVANLDEIIARHGEPPWVEPLVMTDDMEAFVICHPPGQPNDTHYHQHDEWWVVLKGEIDWWIENGHEDEPIHAKAGDFIYAPKYHWHHIEPVGTEPTIRLGIKEPSEFHRYDRGHDARSQDERSDEQQLDRPAPPQPSQLHLEQAPHR